MILDYHSLQLIDMQVLKQPENYHKIQAPPIWYLN